MKIKQLIQEAKYTPSGKTKAWLANNFDKLSDGAKKAVVNFEDNLNDIFSTMEFEMGEEVAESEPEYEFNVDCTEIASYNEQYDRTKKTIGNAAMEEIIEIMCEVVYDMVPDEFEIN